MSNTSVLSVLSVNPGQEPTCSRSWRTDLSVTRQRLSLNSVSKLHQCAFGLEEVAPGWRNGRRAGLRSRWSNPCGFESHPGYRSTSVRDKNSTYVKRITRLVLLGLLAATAAGCSDYS